MRMVDIIEKKRDGEELSKEEIQFFIDGYTHNTIPDYQASALLMAIYFQNMTERECADLTMAMVNSGDTIDLSAIHGIKVDKHSTGGVGDKTSLALTAMVAACGVPVTKMSGRGLGHTGGTIDKLESIKGFHTELSKEQFMNQVNKIKMAIVGQSGNLTPADKKLYALRDVTGTVSSIPLIASSVMSKKIASGADVLVLDVKTGNGAFMKTVEESKILAETMVKIGNHIGRKTIAIISDMSQPLGYAIGNALEVKEAIDLLKGNGPSDLKELCLTLGSLMVQYGGKANSQEEARKMLETVLEDGTALHVFKEFIRAQGGDVSVVDNPSLLPQANYQIEVRAKQSGFIENIDAHELGVCTMQLGAGRATKESEIDLSVGIVLHKKIGNRVTKGEPLLTIYSNQKNVQEIIDKIEQHIMINKNDVPPKKLIYEIIQ